MSIDNIIEQGGTLVIDPYETSFTPDEFLTKYGNIVDSLCIVAKSERGSTYFQSGSAPKDPKYGELFSAFAQITTDIGIETFALIHGNKDAFFSRDPNFQMLRSGGNAVENYVCVAREVYWNYLAEIAAEVTSKTPIDGLILKDAHYPRNMACFCDSCRMSFAADNDYNRDFSYEQVSKSVKFDLWQERRQLASNGLVSSIVQKVHQERKIDIISEIMLDPQTDYFDGATHHFGQNLNSLSQSTSHLLFHLHPWSDLPSTQEQLDSFYANISSKIDVINSISNSLYLWGPNDTQFDYAMRIKDALGSKHIFFTESKPSSYLERRSLHLDLGV